MISWQIDKYIKCVNPTVKDNTTANRDACGGIFLSDFAKGKCHPERSEGSPCFIKLIFLQSISLCQGDSSSLAFLRMT